MHSHVDTYTRLLLRASRPEEGLRRQGGECVAGCAGYYLPRTVTNARQRHFHSHPQLPTATAARYRCRSVARMSSSAAAAYLLLLLRPHLRRSSQEPET